MSSFLVSLSVSGRPCLVVGGDAEALRRAQRLRACGARVTVVADQPRPDVCGSEPCDHGFGVDVPEELQDGATRAVTVYAVDPVSGIEASLGGGSLACGGGGVDPYTYLYQEGESYVRYLPVGGQLEKNDGGPRDAARRMMPIDLHTWSIANFDRDLLMFSHFRLADAGGATLFEYHDTEGAVHVSLAKTERESERGNNHQADLSSFLLVEGTYTVEYTLSADSVGHPSLMVWRQREGNRFLMLVGSSVTGVEQDSVDGDDGIWVDFGETVTRTFTVEFLDEDNALYKSNANGFETG